MASRSTATCSINRRCTCRWSLSRRARRRARATRPSARGASITRCFVGGAWRRQRSRSMPVQPRRGTARPEVVLGEAMKPFLEYGWQPQVMSVDAPLKAILAGKVEIYDISADPARGARPGSAARTVPTRARARRSTTIRCRRRRARRAPQNLDEEARRRLASLGYVSAGAAPVVRKDAPRPADMVRAHRRCSRRRPGLFVERAVRGRDSTAREDPRGGSAQSRRDAAARDRAFGARARVAGADGCSSGRPRSRRARPTSDLYLALHYARGQGLAASRAAARAGRGRDAGAAAGGRGAGRRSASGRGGRADAVALRQKIYTLRTPHGRELVQPRGSSRWRRGRRRSRSRRSRKRARAEGRAFTHDLELGVLYLAARRLQDARAALDRVPSSSPDYPMALFKRAQVSVLLRRAGPAARIAAARQHADATTRPLIARERLFRARANASAAASRACSAA